MLGGAWLFISFMLLLAAVVLRQAPLLLVAVLFFLAAGVARLWARYSLERLEYSRTLSANRVFFGETVTPGVHIANRKILPLPWVHVRDEMPEEVTFLRGRASPSHKEARVTGVDLNPEMIGSSVEKAKSEGVVGLAEFRVADALELPFEDNAFDVVVNECAVGLTADPQRCLDEMARVTKAGGYVAIHESTWLKEVSPQERAEIATRLGTVPYALDEWKEMMTKAGLEDLRNEDWSGLENVSKMRPGARVKEGNIFSPEELKSVIFPRIAERFGLEGIVYFMESAQKTSPLHAGGVLGYSLVWGRKP